MPGPVSHLEALLGQFLHSAEVLWKQYQSVGPGKVDSTSFDTLELAAKRLSQACEAVTKTDTAKSLFPNDSTRFFELIDAIDTVRRLAKRCACSPRGLSFVTGEAGLIPNKQQHREFENQLAKLEQARDWLRQLARVEND